MALVSQRDFLSINMEVIRCRRAVSRHFADWDVLVPLIFLLIPVPRRLVPVQYFTHWNYVGEKRPRVLLAIDDHFCKPLMDFFCDGLGIQ